MSIEILKATPEQAKKLREAWWKHQRCSKQAKQLKQQIAQLQEALKGLEARRELAGQERAEILRQMSYSNPENPGNLVSDDPDGDEDEITIAIEGGE